MALFSAYSSEDDTIAWYDGDGTQKLTNNDIPTNVNIARSVYGIDMDDRCILGF